MCDMCMVFSLFIGLVKKGVLFHEKSAPFFCCIILRWETAKTRHAPIVCYADLCF